MGLCRVEHHAREEVTIFGGAGPESAVLLGAYLGHDFVGPFCSWGEREAEFMVYAFSTAERRKLQRAYHFSGIFLGR